MQGRLKRRHITRLHVGEGLDKHELGHERSQRIGAAELAIAAPHERGVALEVAVVSLLVDGILDAIHHADMVFVVRIGDGCGVVAAGEGLHEPVA